MTNRALAMCLTMALAGFAATDARAQGAMARGQVLDEQGQPIAGVRVELRFMGKEAKTFVRTTNDKGSFVQVGLPSGPYEIHYTKEGFKPFASRTNITAGGVTEIPTETLKAAAAKAAADAGGAPPPGEPDVAKEIQATYAKAMEATTAGRLDESEALFKQILEKAPGLAVAHYNLGYVYTRKKDWPAAEAEFKKAIELQPDRSDTYSALAAVYEATSRRSEALELLSSAGSRFEQDAAFQFNAGIAYLNSGDNARAEAALLKARELDPSKVEVHYYLGTLAVGAGRVDQAVVHLKTYLSASGQNPQNLETAKRLLQAIEKKS
jgi:Tfp pilus assembly protein PilF